MPQPIPIAPPEVAATLDRLVEDLATAAGGPLASLARALKSPPQSSQVAGY